MKSNTAHIVMAFQAAYAIGLLGFGRLIDRIGTRHGYAVSIVAWSLAAMAHALARGVWGFGVARFALGLGEAGNFPAAVKAVTEWFPRRERALATGLVQLGRQRRRDSRPAARAVDHVALRLADGVHRARRDRFRVAGLLVLALRAAGGIAPGFAGGTGAHPQRSARAGAGENPVAQAAALPPDVGLCGGHVVLRADLVVLPLLAAEVPAPSNTAWTWPASVRRWW